MENEERVFLGAYWKDRRLSAREFIKLCYGFLARLREFSSAFDYRCVAIPEGNKFVAAMVPENYELFEQLMIRATPNPERVYVNPDSRGKDFTLQSTTPGGFTISFSDAGHGAVPPTRLSVSITAGVHGEYRTPNSVVINIPADYRKFWENHDKAKKLMEIVVSVWQPAFATLSSSELRRALDPNRTVSFAFGPLTYFADKRAGSVAKGVARIEFSIHGGVFLSMDCSYPWAKSVDCFRPCWSRLNDAGLLQWQESEVSA